MYCTLYIILHYSIVRKMAQYMADILEPEDKDRLHDNLLVGTSKVSSCACLHIYHTFYTWVDCTRTLYITLGYNGGISDSLSMGLGQVSITTTFT